LSHKLKLLSTIFRDPAGTYTCNYDFQKEPSQIDFMATNISRSKVRYCRTFRSAATVTDHRGLVMSFATKLARNKRYWAPRGKPKPSGWHMTDGEFNDFLRDSSNIEHPKIHSDRDPAYHLFTDGGYIRGKRNVAKAGWGFVLFDECRMPSEDSEVLAKAFGPTVVEQGTNYWVGAQKRSNNTSELSAAIEALLYISGQDSEEHPALPRDGRLVWWTDSKYVLGLIQGKFRPRENVYMSKLVGHLWTECKKWRDRFEIIWVKGHSGDFGNDVADQLADNCGDYMKRADWWKRPYKLGD